MSRDITKAADLLQEFWPKLKAAYEEFHPGCELFITHVDRTPVEQLHLFLQGRLPADEMRKLGLPVTEKVVTWKDGFVKRSKHNAVPSLAFDVAVREGGVVSWDPALVLKIGAFVPSLGYEGRIKWGGLFADYYHWEVIQ